MVFALFSLPFWGVGGALLTASLKASFVSETLVLDSSGYTIATAMFGWEVSVQNASLADLAGPPVLSCVGDSSCMLLFEDGVSDLAFGSRGGAGGGAGDRGGGCLLVREARWLQKEVQKHLKEVADAAGKSGLVRLFSQKLVERSTPQGSLDSRPRAGAGGVHFGVSGFGVVVR
jgi:hypothetical protein